MRNCYLNMIIPEGTVSGVLSNYIKDDTKTKNVRISMYKILTNMYHSLVIRS